MPDLKGLFHLPFDKENDGVKVAQAFVFPKGKALHVPTWPGKYVTAGEHAHVTVLCLVHFKSPVVPPALLTAFVDHEAADDRMKGVSVESVRLPLKLRNNVYQKETDITPIEDVVGFSPLQTGTPFSTDLAPALKGISPFAELRISTASEMSQFVGGKLSERISVLSANAKQRMEAVVAEIKKGGDARAATNARAKYYAQLHFVTSAIESLPLRNYDARVRVVLLDMDEPDTLPSFIETPLKTGLVEGRAQLERTRFVLPEGSADESRGSGPSTAPPPLSPVMAREGGDGVEQEEEIDTDARRSTYLVSEEEEEEDQPPHAIEVPEMPVEQQQSGQRASKRQRKSTDHFDAAPATRKAAVAASKVPPEPANKSGAAGKKPAAADGDSAPPINPRSGQPYVRGGPYQRKQLPADVRAAAKAAQKVLAEQKAAAAAAAAAAAVGAGDPTELKATKKSLAQAQETISNQQAEISTLNAKALQLAEQLATALSSKESYGHEMYLDGLRAGAELAHGRSLPPASAHGAGSSASK